jgi:DegV family protein with EDD domain
MSTAIVTDSTSDLPSKLATENKITVIPNIIVINGVEYEDGKGMTREEFYTRLPSLKEQPSTGTASSGTYEKLYEHLLNHGAYEIFSIHAASSLSGIFNAASMAAQNFVGRVRVIDSGTLSMGLGFLALKAAQAALQGLSAREIEAHVTAFNKRLRLIAMLDTLEFVRRSGRVSWAQARLGSMLDIKPFLEVKAGKIHSLGETRTRSKGLQRLAQMLLSQGAIEKLAILHTNAAEEAHLFWEKLQIALPEEPFFVNVTTVIGTHVGPNALGFVAVSKEE